MFSPDNGDQPEQVFEEAYEELPEKQQWQYHRRPFSQFSSDSSLGFAQFMNSLRLPPGVTSLMDDPHQSADRKELVKNIRYLVAEMYSGELDLRKIQLEKEALYRVAKPLPEPELLAAYPFVMRVFMVANNQYISHINWSEDGLELEVNYLELQDHLTSGRSLFHCRSITQFIDELQGQGFMRFVKEEAKSESQDFHRPIMLYFEHMDLARDNLVALQKLLEKGRLLDKSPAKNLVGKDEAEEDEDEDEQDEEAGKAPKQFRVPLHMPAPGLMSRMRLRGDRCVYTSTSTRSALQVARCRLRTLLEHQYTVNILQASSQLQKPRPWGDLPPFISSSIQFGMPHDSVILLNEQKPPNYAGYYGEVDDGKVTRFFADYLPRYGNKLTGYKDIILETSPKAASSFQQNLPIGLAYSDGEDLDDDDVPPPASPADPDSDLDCKPSTSAAAAAAAAAMRSRKATESVEDQDLEEAMQELCGGSTGSVLKENVSGNRGKAKASQSTPRKRSTKCLEFSSSSDNEPPVSKKGKKAKKEKKAKKDKKSKKDRKSKNIPLETIDENRDPLSEEVIPSSRGKTKSKSKSSKSKPRKRHSSSSEEDPSPKGKRLKKGGVPQTPRKRKNFPLEDLVEEDEEEPLVKKTPKRKMIVKTEEDEELDVEQEEFLEENEVIEEDKNFVEEDFEEEMIVEALEDEDVEDPDEFQDATDPEVDEDEEEDAEENYEDDDDDDYNVQYRAAPQEAEKPTRYNLRNSKRQKR